MSQGENLLLHTCCAPCFIYPSTKLKECGHSITGFFYNPNIHPLIEYQERRKSLVDYSGKLDLDIIYPAYVPSEFSDALGSETERPARCCRCWELRLGTTAQYAKARGFTAFSTTLLVSPYQDQESLKRIGHEIAAKAGVRFYWEDFRPGYNNARVKAKNLGLYLQKYCGCRYSQDERNKRLS